MVLLHPLLVVKLLFDLVQELSVNFLVLGLFKDSSPHLLAVAFPSYDVFAFV